MRSNAGPAPDLQRDEPQVAPGPGDSVAALLHRRLRAATAQRHRALEAMLPIAHAPASLATYRDHLRFLLGFHAALEPRLLALGPLHACLPDLPGRQKTALLQADLGRGAGGRRPGPGTVPRPRTASQGLGVLYVTEGATLGARTLLPGLREAGVVPGAVGARYLEGYGAATGHWWKRFLHALEAVPGNEADDVVGWARHTFDALCDWRRAWDAAV